MTPPDKVVLAAIIVGLVAVFLDISHATGTPPKWVTGSMVVLGVVVVVLLLIAVALS